MPPPPRAPGRRSQAESARTRKRILDHAEKLFANQGFGRATLRDIAARAGVHQRSIQHHFGSKAGLYEAVLGRWDEALMQQISGAVRGATDLTSTIDRVVEDLFDFFLAKRHWVALTARTGFGERLPKGVRTETPRWARFTRDSLEKLDMDIGDLDVRRLLITVEGLFHAHTLASNRYRHAFGADVTDPVIRADTKRHLKEVLLAILGASLQRRA